MLRSRQRRIHRWRVARLSTLALGILALASVQAAVVPSLKLQDPQRTRFAEPPLLLKDFELVDQDARSFRFSQLRGHAALVFFGFTNCPNVCPPTLQLLRQVQRTLRQEGTEVDIVFISVDGERDTPAAMKKYLEPFMPGFVGLTGDPKAVKDIATEFSAVFFKGMPTDTAGGYNVEHTSQVYLVDRTGRMRATFFSAPAADMEAVTTHFIREKSRD